MKRWLLLIWPALFLSISDFSTEGWDLNTWTVGLILGVLFNIGVPVTLLIYLQRRHNKNQKLKKYI